MNLYEPPKALIKTDDKKAETHPVVGIILILLVPFPMLGIGLIALYNASTIKAGIGVLLLLVAPPIYIIYRIISSMNKDRKKNT